MTLSGRLRENPHVEAIFSVLKDRSATLGRTVGGLDSSAAQRAPQLTKVWAEDLARGVQGGLRE